MKKILWLTTIIALSPAAIFASEEQVDCEDLARYIQSDLKKTKLGVYEEGLFRKTLMVSFVERLDVTEEEYYYLGCKEAGKNYKSEAIKVLPKMICQFKEYQNALQQCATRSKTACPLTTKVMQDLQLRMDRSSACISLYNQGKLEQSRKDKEDVAKSQACQAYIKDSKSKN